MPVQRRWNKISLFIVTKGDGGGGGGGSAAAGWCSYLEREIAMESVRKVYVLNVAFDVEDEKLVGRYGGWWCLVQPPKRYTRKDSKDVEIETMATTLYPVLLLLLLIGSLLHEN
ncbi:hypothetical protein M0804_002578 [Polistes exclamans]|nr:hypothetical protein M0804_002578 [Polistes exclamans]